MKAGNAAGVDDAVSAASTHLLISDTSSVVYDSAGKSADVLLMISEVEVDSGAAGSARAMRERKGVAIVVGRRRASSDGDLLYERKAN